MATTSYGASKQTGPTPGVILGAQKWDKIYQQASSAGIPISSYQSLAERDLRNIQQGGQGLGQDEIIAGIMAASGQAPVLPAKKKSGLNPLNIISNIGGDVKDITTKFLPGLVNYVHHLPSEATNSYRALAAVDENPNSPEGKWAASQGYEVGANRGVLGALRNVSKLPLMQVIPGVHTAAGLTTPEGRADLTRHPLMTFLDVFPYVSEAGKVATMGRDVAAGSAAEALAAGNPVKAAFRKVGGTTTDELGVTLPRTSMVSRNIARNFLISKPVQELATNFSVLNRQQRLRVVDHFKDWFGPKGLDVTPEQLDTFGTKLQDYNLGHDVTWEPHEGVLLDTVKRANNWARDEMLRDRAVKVGVNGGDVSIGAHPDLYEVPVNYGTGTDAFPIDHPVAMSHARIGEWGNKLTEANDHLVGLTDRVSTGTPTKEIQRSFDHWVRKAKTAKSNMLKADKDFKEALLQNPHARFRPFLQDAVKSGAVDIAREAYHGANLDNVIRQISEATSEGEMRSVLGPAAYDKLVADTKSSLQHLTANGFDPVYLHKVDPDALKSMTASAIPDQFYRPGVSKDYILNWSPGVNNVLMAVSEPALQIIRSQGTEAHLINNLLPHAVLQDTLTSQLRDTLRSKYHDPDTLNAKVQQVIRDNYDVFPTDRFAGKVNLAADQVLLLPKELSRANSKLMDEHGNLGVKGAYNKAMNAYKMSVLTGPRHLAHVALGGTTMMMLREPLALRNIKSAWDLVHNAEEMPARLSMPINHLETADLHSYVAGKSMGRMASAWGKTGGRAINWMNHLEDMSSQMQRVMSLLEKEKRGVNRDLAIREVNDMFVNMDSMTPYERSIIKNVMPFWGFTKAIMKYVLSYPVDHPIRASILSRLSQQQQEEWATGLPKSLQSLFYFGKPNKKGDQWAIEGKTLNPFRSLGDIWGLTGFISALNPAAAGLLEATGVNTLNGASELYPNTYMDEETGSIKAARPSNPLFKIAHAFIPELNAMEALFGTSDRFRRLKAEDPSGYRKQLLGYLNIPFVPHTVNKPLEASHAEISRFKQAQKEVSKGIKTGDWSSAKQYNLVPYQGMLVDPKVLSFLIEQIRTSVNQQTGGKVAIGAAVPQIAPGYRAPKRKVK